jgi:hypothetical protein
MGLGLGLVLLVEAEVWLAQVVGVVPLDRMGVYRGGKQTGHGRGSERRKGEAIGRGGAVENGVDADGIGEKLAYSVCYLLGSFIS